MNSNDCKVFHEIGLSDKVTLQEEHHKVSSSLARKFPAIFMEITMRTLEDAGDKH